MIALQKAGTIRHIGVSNFGTAEMRQLKAAFPDAPPVTLQSKFNPYHRVCPLPPAPSPIGHGHWVVRVPQDIGVATPQTFASELTRFSSRRAAPATRVARTFSQSAQSLALSSLRTARRAATHAKIASCIC